MKYIYILVKRLMDIILCSCALIAFIPLFLGTAVAIKISDEGTVFYTSRRGGIHGKPFRFYKFRSMRSVDRDRKMFVADPDRVFPVGRIIRRLKIDELPQLLNVIKGDMSIVGPRPMSEQDVDTLYAGKYARVKHIKPGLTSAASLYDYSVGDTYTDNALYVAQIIPVKLELELYYADHRSLRYDLELICRTMVMILQVLLRSPKLLPVRECRLIGEKGIFDEEIQE